MRKVDQKPIQPKVSSLERMCQYVVGANPRAVMKVMYANGFLPYDSKQPVNDYLVKHCIQLVREEGDNGIGQVLSVHPDKDLIVELFGASQATTIDAPHSDSSNFTGSDKVAQNVAPLYPVKEESTPSTDSLAVIGLLLLIILIIVIIW